MTRLPLRRAILLPVLMLWALAAAGCSTQTYYRDDGTKVTVKKFAGVPYLEKEERTKVVPPSGSEK